MKKKYPTRGFASMNLEKRTEIARRGGIAAHQKGTAHEFTSEEARKAGRIGGRGHKRSHMAIIGRLGGMAGKGKGKRVFVK
jgi:uncharacterized protein